MAERRMFAKSIVLSDAFLDMPMSARCLYFTLGMFADDDGFVNSPKSIMRQCGASLDDMNVLIAKKFILAFEDGIIVIKHWRINNYLRSDRYRETTYIDEKKALKIEENGAYKLDGIPTVYQVDTIGIPSIGKNSIDKDKEYILSDDSDIVSEILSYLNEKVGTNYRPSTRKTRDLIKARQKENFSLDDFKTVINKKTAEWKGTDMEKYLRPETLFGTKFESYLNQREVKPKEDMINHNYSEDYFEQRRRKAIEEMWNG